MDKIMEQVKDFIIQFLNQEAECWTKRQSTDLEGFNQCIGKLYAMAIDQLDQGLGIYYRKELTFQEEVSYKPRHLYKLSSYNNKIYGGIWVAYASNTTTDSDPKSDTIFEAFIISEIENQLKVIGKMTTCKNRSTMIIEGWKASVYNPSELDIKKLGTFTGTERYFESGNYDNFSLAEYLKDS